MIPVNTIKAIEIQKRTLSPENSVSPSSSSIVAVIATKKANGRIRNPTIIEYSNAKIPCENQNWRVF
jgi:hypothetical protein